MKSLEGHRLSYAGVLSKRLNESSWFWEWEVPSNKTVLERNSGISRNKLLLSTVTSPQTPDGLILHRLSIVETCYQLSSRKVDAQSVINWTVGGQLS